MRGFFFFIHLMFFWLNFGAFFFYIMSAHFTETPSAMVGILRIRLDILVFYSFFLRVSGFNLATKHAFSNQLAGFRDRRVKVLPNKQYFFVVPMGHLDTKTWESYPFRTVLGYDRLFLKQSDVTLQMYMNVMKLTSFTPPE